MADADEMNSSVVVIVGIVKKEQIEFAWAHKLSNPLFAEKICENVSADPVCSKSRRFLYQPMLNEIYLRLRDDWRPSGGRFNCSSFRIRTNSARPWSVSSRIPSAPT